MPLCESAHKSNQCSVLVAVKSILTFTVRSAASKVNQHYIYLATLPVQHDVGRLDIPVTPVLMHVSHDLHSNTQTAWLQIIVDFLVVGNQLAICLT